MPRKPVKKPSASASKRKAFSLRPTPRTDVRKKETKQAAKEPPKPSGKFRSVRGMRDILPEEYARWTHLYRSLDKSVREFGYRRIEVPMLEFADLYKRSVGEGTDIVEKELFEFTTRGGDRVAMRPEMTAGVARAFLENGMQVWAKPIKLFACGSVFRYDRPQAGRYREHRQASFEVFGEVDPILDAQLIQAALRVLRGAGLKHVHFLVNSLGMAEDRKEYRDILKAHLRSNRRHLCEHCRERMKKNPLRVLDCKEESCREVAQGAPHLIDHLSKESHDHFKRVLEYLDELEISYEIDPFLVRGLDYYNDTVFEVVCNDGSESEEKPLSIGGGGRYDDLIRDLGGEDTPAAGFGLGLDRIILEMEKQNTKLYQEPKPRVFLAQLGEMAKKKSLNLFEQLEKNGILLTESFGRGALKSQLRQASKAGAELTIILGQKEALDQTVIVKDMRTGSQETVPQDKLVEFVKKALRK